ncbi:hypothetical protein AC578_408 [Pseudocercospora eumusae]|uniref:Uncharacterized protein n=1 Tax=Pseudocercospora eumusae TaxID=321146 RepID=A0A139HY38_9PEZI|nr:hypothetical protein AC578_408 [Pseudocercospora eumusae]
MHRPSEVQLVGGAAAEAEAGAASLALSLLPSTSPLMTSLVTAYTELEQVLLFQALRADGVHSISFNRISDQLKTIPLVRSDPSYDSGRLSPDALRELYLGLLKDEVKRDLERQQNGDSHITNAHVSPGSRKRKAPSPSLPTVNEAAQHSHLIPQLVERLYATYREKTLVKLKGYESKYADTKREINEIDAGQWDESLQRAKPSPKPSSTAHTQPVLLAPTDHATRPTSASASPVVSKPAENATQAPAKRYSQAKIDAVINHAPEPHGSPGGHRRASSNTKLPPLSEMAPQSPRFGIPPKIPGPPPHQSMQQMPPHASNHAYSQTPPTAHQSPYAPHHPHPRQGSMNSPQIQQSLSRPSSSPRPILPPPPGMSLPPPSPVPHSASPRQAQYAPALAPQPHYQPPPQHRNMQPAPPHPGYPVTSMHQHPPAGYYQQQPYPDRRTSYQPQQPQTPTYPSHPPMPNQQPYMQPHPSHGQQSMYMQPFQVAPQDPNRPIVPQHHRPSQSPMPVQATTPYSSYVHNGPATGPRPPPQQAHLVSDIIAALATPPRPKTRPLWKEGFRPSPVVTGAEVPRPIAEPLSPTLERAKSPARSTRSTRGRDVPTVEEPLHAEPASKTRSSRRKNNTRDRSPHSVVSSTADESKYARSTRSQSVSTAAGAYPPSEDRPGSRNGVKAEPSTPANMLEEAEPMQAPSTSTTGMVTRKRRGTLQSQPAPTNNKRKRQESPAAATTSTHHEDESSFTPPPRSNIVVATRNFAKMSSAVMNDILSHKHAAYFNAPVRDKDAPGYSDLVLQPQNLKAIRSAITAGTHAIKAASAAMDDSSDPTTGTIELERTADVIPPKVIVNGAQLEKELYRMFANAYMFNPGEDGMALSTKEMFEDVEAKMSEWRGTERLAGVEEEEDGKGKRRKV